MIARKQRAAIKSAKHLIDFTNIGLEHEQLERVNRNGDDVEEVIVFSNHQPTDAVANT